MASGMSILHKDYFIPIGRFTFFIIMSLISSVCYAQNMNRSDAIQVMEAIAADRTGFPINFPFNRKMYSISYNSKSNIMSLYFTENESDFDTFVSQMETNMKSRDDSLINGITNDLDLNKIRELAFMNDDAYFFKGFIEYSKDFKESVDILKPKFRSIVFSSDKTKTLISYVFDSEDINILKRLEQNGASEENVIYAFPKDYGAKFGMLSANRLMPIEYTEELKQTKVSINGKEIIYDLELNDASWELLNIPKTRNS